MADQQPTAAPDAPWLVLQKKIFARYVSQQLRKAGIKQQVVDVVNELKDGLLLINLMEAMSGKSFGPKPKPTTVRIQQIDAVNRALEFVKQNGIKHKASAEDIVDGNANFVLGLIYAVIIKYMKLDEEDSQGADVKEALTLWLRNRLVGYDLSIESSFTKSLQDGLVFNALIHKMRPKLIPFHTLDKKDKIGNLKLALETAEKYCNVEKYLEPEDIGNLDDIGMTVYLYDWYYGVSLLQKQDVAARRIGKLADMTKLHDQMKADYNAAAASLVEWIDSQVTVLNDRSIDNTMAGIRAKLDRFYAYKSQQKGDKIVGWLDLQALFDNLALRLRNNKRPPFQPPQSPPFIEDKFKSLEEAESQCSLFLHTELERQIKLDKLGKRFRADASNLDTYFDEKIAVANAAEQVDSIDMANYHLEQHALFEQEIETAKATRLANIGKVLAELKGESYEFSNELQGLLDQLQAKFNTLSGASSAKKQTLLGELEKQKKINDDLCKALAEAVNKFGSFLNDKKVQLNDKNADLKTLLSFVDATLTNTSEPDSLLAAIASVDAKVQDRQITLNPYTNITANDTKAQWYQFTLTLKKKKELLEAEIEAASRSGLSEEQVREVNDNFDYFDKDKSGILERRELRTCLQSLGEDATPADVDKLLAEYAKQNPKSLAKSEFAAFMLKKLGDSNTQEEILEGFKLLSLDKPTIALHMLEAVVNELTFKQHHVDYLKAEMPKSGADHDYAAWTAAVFAR